MPTLRNIRRAAEGVVRRCALQFVSSVLLAGGIAGCKGEMSKPSSPPIVQANDNRKSAGVRHGDTVVVKLTAQMARWFPEDSSKLFVDVITLAEEGQAPQIPGPLLRFPSGTIVDLTVTNTLADSAIWLHGFATHPIAKEDSVRIAPGKFAHMTFEAGAPGTYSYFVWPGIVDRKHNELETASGAIVVDSVGTTSLDRVFVINIWGRGDSTSARNALAINGKSWPNTERIVANVGDSIRWRWVNASMRVHPMHLHGFYFRVDARGDGLSDTAFTSASQRMMVTEVMNEGSTMAITWNAARAGNWLFHCHFGFHVTPDARLDEGVVDTAAAHSHDPAHHMAGLVMGIDVKSSAQSVAEPRDNPRPMRLLVQERSKRSRAARSLGYVLQNGNVPPAADSVVTPGTPLVLHVGEPTDITVVNHLKEATAVHWHGIELESYSDGVAGWSGTPSRMAPPIAPNDSFVAHLTLRRAGTFMYHTHLNDMAQLSSGLYGGIVVLPRGQEFDSATDHLFVAGWDGEEDPPHLLINGDSIGRPMVLKAGVAHRFRFVAIGIAGGLRPMVKRDSTMLKWEIVARDGAELMKPRAVSDPKGFLIVAGQTVDFSWRPPAPGSYTLSITSAGRVGYFVVPLTVR